MSGSPVFEVLYYQTEDRKQPMVKWLEELRADRLARAAVQIRIDRIERGLLGDWKSVGGGICELRIDHGPGYRIYFARDGQSVVILLCGGYKGTQGQDVRLARRYWKDYEKRKRSSGSPA